MPLTNEHYDQMRGAWHAAKEKQSSFFGAGRWPDDNYLVEIDRALARENDWGNAEIVVDVKAIAGDREGDTTTFTWGASIEGGCSFFMQFVAKLGYTVPDEPEELEKLLADMTSDRLQFLADIRESPNEKKPQYPYYNIDVIETSAEVIESMKGGPSGSGESPF